MTPSDHDIPTEEYKIRTVLTDFVELADSADEVGKIAALFSADATLRIGAESWRGREAIATCLVGMRVQGGVGPGSRKAHFLTNVSVHIMGTARATARSRFLLTDASGSAPAVVVTGRYVDELHWNNGQWLIADRQILVD